MEENSCQKGDKETHVKPSYRKRLSGDDDSDSDWPAKHKEEKRISPELKGKGMEKKQMK